GQEIRDYAHQGIELNPIRGVAPTATPAAPRVAAAKPSGEAAPRPALLTRRGAEILVRLERLMDDATRALVERGEAGRRAEKQPSTPEPATRTGNVAATGGPPVRGN